MSERGRDIALPAGDEAEVFFIGGAGSSPASAQICRASIRSAWAAERFDRKTCTTARLDSTRCTLITSPASRSAGSAARYPARASSRRPSCCRICGPLGERPGPLDAFEVVQRRVDLAQCAACFPTPVEDEREAHPCFAGQLRRVRVLGGPHRRGQAGRRIVEFGQVQRGQSTGPLRDRQHVERAQPRGAFRHVRAQCPGAAGFPVGEPERFVSHCLELRVHVGPMDAESGLWQYRAAIGAATAKRTSTIRLERRPLGSELRFARACGKWCEGEPPMTTPSLVVPPPISTGPTSSWSPPRTNGRSSTPLSRWASAAPRRFDRSAELGLTLVGFAGDQLNAWWGAGTRQGASAIDAVLAALRDYFGDLYSGWYPTLGKNRFVQHVDGFYHVGGWGDDGITSIAVENAPALRSGTAGQGVRVGVPDTAVYPHSWLGGGFHALKSSLLRPTGVADGEPAQLPLSAGHGTFVTGRILMEAPGATVEVLRCLDQDGQADAWEAAKALVTLARSGVQVLNVSFGCRTEDGQPPLVLSAAVDRLPSDVLVVAAAGNFGGTSATSSASDTAARGAAWPAALDDVLAVGALDENGDPAAFSPTAPWVDVYAPGVRVESTYLDGSFRVYASNSDEIKTPTGFARWSGTSFSAALVSGRVAAGIIPGRVDARASFAALRDSLRQGTSPCGTPDRSAQPHPFRDEGRRVVRCAAHPHHP